MDEKDPRLEAMLKVVYRNINEKEYYTSSEAREEMNIRLSKFPWKNDKV
jgi:hypothetical protein